MKNSEEQRWQLFLVVLLQPSSQTILTTFFYPKLSVRNNVANYHLISKTFLLNDQYQTMKEKTCNIVKDVQN